MSLVLDSSAMVALLRDEPGAEVVEAVLIESEATAYAHAINVMEVYYDVRRQHGDVAAREVIAVLASLGITTREDFDEELWTDAANLKSDFRRVSLADCIGVALARRLGGEFVTADRHELESLERAGTATFLFVR